MVIGVTAPTTGYKELIHQSPSSLLYFNYLLWVDEVKKKQTVHDDQEDKSISAEHEYHLGNRVSTC